MVAQELIPFITPSGAGVFRQKGLRSEHKNEDSESRSHSPRVDRELKQSQHKLVSPYIA
jgi:hypothetical protein